MPDGSQVDCKLIRFPSEPCLTHHLDLKIFALTQIVVEKSSVVTQNKITKSEFNTFKYILVPMKYLDNILFELTPVIHSDSKNIR